MKQIIFLILSLIFVSIFLFCTKNSNPLDDSKISSNSEINLAVSVLFKQAGIATSPDSVDTLRFTLKYGNNLKIYAFNFSDHKGVITGIPVNTAFTLKIEGLDKQKNILYLGLQNYESAYDDLTIKITANEVTPLAPSDLRLEALTESSIKVEWKDNSSNELGFIVERSLLEDSAYTVIDTAISNQVALMDNDNLSAGTIYYYRIASYNSAGVSSYLTPQAVIVPNIEVIDSIAPTLIVDVIPDSVAVESLTVTGKVYDSSGILIVTVNGDTATLGSDSSYSAVIKLNLGKDTITVIATDNSSRKNDTTAVVYVVYNITASDKTAPVITSSPSDSDTVLTLTPNFTGTVNDVGGTVDTFKVNGVIVLPDGINWNKTLTLADTGWNKIVFIAVDASNNYAYDTISIYADTTTEDTIAPIVSFGSMITGFMFATDSPTVTIGIVENGSGIDSVYIEGVVAIQSGSDWSAEIGLMADSNWVNVVVKDRADNRAEDSILVIVNRTPVFTTQISELSIQAYVGAEYKDTIVASDLDGISTLTYTKLFGHSGMSIGITTGIIVWTPNIESTEKCSVVVTDKYSTGILSKQNG